MVYNVGETRKWSLMTLWEPWGEKDDNDNRARERKRAEKKHLLKEGRKKKKKEKKGVAERQNRYSFYVSMRG